MDKIRARIQKKIANHSETLENDSAISLAEETKKNLLKMFEQYEDNESVVSDPVEIKKYNNKFQDLDYLNQAKMKISELTLANDRLKLELLESNKYVAIKEMLDKERSRGMEQEDRIIAKHKKEIQQNKTSFEAKLEKNLKYIDELLEQKAKFNQRAEGFVMEKKKLLKDISQVKQKAQIELKSKLENVIATEKEKRIKWEQAKIVELKENTIKGMEPELNSIITRSRNQIKAAEERCEKEKVEHREQCYREFEKKILEFKQEAFRENEGEKEKLRVDYSTKLKEQYEKMEIQFANDREKMRQTYKVDIQDLQYKRKNEQQQFMKKNRSLYDDHLEQMKRIREVYEDRIKILEAGQKYLESEKQKLSLKFDNSTKQQIQKFKRDEREKLKAAYAKLQQKFDNQKQEYINKIAVMNSEFEKDIEIKYESKKKDEKKLFEDQIRKLKRDVSVLEEKLQKQNKTSGEVSKEKDHFETQYMELKLKYDESVQQLKETKLKVKQLEKELDTLKLSLSKQIENKVEIERTAKNKQIDNLRKLIERQQQDRLLLDRSNQSKIKQSDKKWADQMDNLSKQAQRLLEKKTTQIQNLKKQVKKHQQLAKGYEGMLEKQRQQLMASLYK